MLFSRYKSTVSDMKAMEHSYYISSIRLQRKKLYVIAVEEECRYGSTLSQPWLFNLGERAADNQWTGSRLCGAQGRPGLFREEENIFLVSGFEPPNHAARSLVSVPSWHPGFFVHPCTLFITNHIKNIQYGDQTTYSTGFFSRRRPRFSFSRKNSDRIWALCTIL